MPTQPAPSPPSSHSLIAALVALALLLCASGVVAGSIYRRRRARGQAVPLLRDTARRFHAERSGGEHVELPDNPPSLVSATGPPSIASSAGRSTNRFVGTGATTDI